MLWIIKDNNADATKYYLDILEKSAILVGQKVKQVNNVNCAKSGSKEDTYLVTTPIDALKIYLMGKRRIIIWFQGVFSEESYLKHKSYLRKLIIGFVEKFMLKKSKFIFFVSNEMKRYYTNRFNVNIEAKHYIMPCFNSAVNRNSFMTEGKYRNNVFCYAGSLSVWQGFDKILNCYKNIEELGEYDTELMILTKEQEKAKELIEKAGIKNYTINYVTLEQLPSILGKAKFGFILRDNSVVNRVSTPTKISTYMANGLIPIYSECIVDFHENSSNMKYIISVDNKDFPNQIGNLMKNDLDASEIYSEYSRLFKTYFNEEYHANQIALLTKNIY